MDRVLGIVEGKEKGPLVICVCALHGNEQVSIRAFERVCDAINKHQIPFKGKFVGLLGNIEAVKLNQRFIDADLNRVWEEEYLEYLKVKPKAEYTHEDREMLELKAAIAEHDSDDYEIKVIADLHATSSENGNFIVVPPGISDHAIIKALHLPVVVDLDQYLIGTLLGYVVNHGFISFAFEGGLIGSDQALNLHVSGLWEILEAAGCITHNDHMNEDHYANQLMEISSELPKQVKVLHRHWVEPTDGFKMKPGFVNFERINKGQLLASDDSGDIHSPHDGMIFMPLYQDTGNDGFFVVEEVTSIVETE